MDTFLCVPRQAPLEMEVGEAMGRWPMSALAVFGVVYRSQQRGEVVDLDTVVARLGDDCPGTKTANAIQLLKSVGALAEFSVN